MEQPSSSNQSGKKRFELVKFDAIALWSWNHVADCCAICRNQSTEPCMKCQAANKYGSEDECPIAWGVCYHVFHHHCIDRWLKTRNVCPLDNTEWKYLKFGKN